MMKIFITGGTEFIGSNLAEELAKEHEIVIIDNLSTGQAENVAGLDVELVQGSITDPDLLKENFRGVNYVFHHAALPSVQRSVEDPVKTNDVNVGGTLNVLVAARDADVKKVIYASSSSAYDDTPELPEMGYEAGPKVPVCRGKTHRRALLQGF